MVARWDVEPGVLLTLGAVGAVYVRGWHTYHERAPARCPDWRLGAFLGGLVSLWLAAASPADTLADELVSAHMVQHILLLAVAPPLLLLGNPVLPIVRGLPLAIRRTVVRPLSHQRWLRRIAHTLMHPGAAFVISSVILWAWHVPALYDFALQNPAVHAAEHALFCAGGMLFWWPVVQPWPSRSRWPRGAIIPYLLAADVQNTLLAAILTFSDRVLYPWYTQAPHAPQAAGMTPLEDQVLAGVLMWVAMSLAYLVPALGLTVRLLSPSPTLGPAAHSRVHRGSWPASG